MKEALLDGRNVRCNGKNFVRNKEKRSGLLCVINPVILQGMLKNYSKDGEKKTKNKKRTRRSRTMVLQKVTDISMDGLSCKEVLRKMTKEIIILLKIR